MGELALLPQPEQGPGNLAVGRAGEFRVASELLLRGFMPLMSTVDTGADIVLDTGATLQVKASRERHVQKRGNGAPSYHFRFSTFSRAQGVRQRMLADYAICWGIEDDLFWVIPAAVIGSRSSVHVPAAPTRASMFDSYLGAWELLK